MLKYSKHFLKKLESLFEALGYVVRYEKGNFQSGYCLVQDRKIAVINKFFETEARVSVLLEILDAISPDTAVLDEKNAKLLKAVQNREVTMVESEEQEGTSK
jgi:hypothetical protein